MKKELIELKNKIKELSAQSVSIRKSMQSLSGMDKWHAWEDKRLLGESTRFYLLAYGFLRGLTYHKMENNSNMDFWIYCSLNFRHLLKIIEEYRPSDCPEWTLEMLKNEILGKEEEKVAA